MTLDLRIEPGRAEDLDRVTAIEREVNPAAWSRALFERELRFERGRFFVAREGARLIGYAGLWMAADEAQISTIGVEKDRQGLGVGLKLLQHLHETARSLGAARVTLEVRAGNSRAIRFYGKAGYHPTGRRDGIYPPNGEAAVSMEKKL